MAKQHIKIGDTPNDRTGDPLRTAFEKVNANFDELYAKDVSTQYHLGDDTQFVDIDPATGTVVIQSGYDTGMPVYIKGANCADGGVGGNVVIEAGGPPLGELITGTVGNVEIAAQQTSIDSNGKVWTFGDSGMLGLPEDTGYIYIPASGGIIGTGVFDESNLPDLAIGATNSVRINTNSIGNMWTFDKSGTINTPLLFPLSFTAVLDEAHRTVGAGSYTGPAWEFNLEWQVSPGGQIELLSDTGPLPSLVVGYADGQTFEFTEADHGIPNYTLTVELYNVVYAGPAGWTANLSFSPPPEYPSTVKSLGAIKLTSNGHSIILGTDGYLTTENIHLQGSLKGVDGNTGTTGQVLTRQSNGGVAWANATGGGGVSIGDFGEGFSLNGSNKIVTNKLYSTNLTQSTQHYRLELDTNGVVHLPDQSIINGATLKTVSGGWAGITAGPAGHDEDSWVYVDNDGAWIATKYSTDQFTWHFDNNGNTTFPNGIKFDNSEGNTFALNSGTVSSIDLRTDGGRGFYTDNGGFSLRSNGTYTWNFGSDGTLNLPQSVSTGNAIIQTTSPINIQVNSNAHAWTFGTDGLLTFPGADGFQATFGSVEPVGDVLHSVNSLYLESEGTVGLISGAQVSDLETIYNDYVVQLSLAFEAESWTGAGYPASHTSETALTRAKALNPLIPDNWLTLAHQVFVAWDAWQTALDYTNISVSVGTKEWAFSNNGKITLPAGGNIVDSEGETVLGFASTSYSLSDVLTTILGEATTSGVVVTGDVTGTFPPGTEIQFESLAGAEYTVATAEYDSMDDRTVIILTDFTGFGPVDGDKIYIEYHGVQEIYAGSNIALGVTEGNSGRVLTIAAVIPNTLQLQEKPTTNAGQIGDKKGMTAIDSAGGDFYYCINDYTDGQSAIWAKVTGSTQWI